MISVEVSHYSGRTSLEDGKIDTGADGTSIPEYLVKKLDLNPTGEVISVQGVNGDPVPRDTYDVHIKIGNVKFELLQVIALPRDNVLIGRDLINLWHLTLDGKTLQGEIKPWSNNPADVL
jgi:predicted aspartyl protease